MVDIPHELINEDFLCPYIPLKNVSPIDLPYGRSDESYQKLSMCTLGQIESETKSIDLITANSVSIWFPQWILLSHLVNVLRADLSIMEPRNNGENGRLWVLRLSTFTCHGKPELIRYVLLTFLRLWRRRRLSICEIDMVVVKFATICWRPKPDWGLHRRYFTDRQMVGRGVWPKDTVVFVIVGEWVSIKVKRASSEQEGNSLDTNWMVKSSFPIFR